MASPSITTPSYRRQQLELIKAAKEASDKLIDEFVLKVQGILTRHADKNGVIPNGALRLLQSQISHEYAKLVLGTPQSNKRIAPFVVHHNEIMPRSAFAHLLWKYIVDGATLSTRYQSSLAKKHIPQDIQDALKKLPPPNPAILDNLLSKYESPVDWLDPRQRRLSDRLWNTVAEGQRKIDRFLENNILHRTVNTTETQDEDGELTTQTTFTPKHATQIAQDFAKAGLFYELTRLAINEAYGATIRTSWASATLNPSIVSYSPKLSASHAIEDECDIEAANAPYPIDDLSHLPGFHPNCMCDVEYNFYGEFDWNNFDVSNSNDNTLALWFLLYGGTALVNKFLSPKNHENATTQP